MVLSIPTENVPLKMTNDGVLLIGDTRVPLETVIAAYHRGAIPEGIVLQYPTLELSDVYLVIGYYLDHQPELDRYIAEQRHNSEILRREVEAQSNLAGLRERLLARRKQQQ